MKKIIYTLSFILLAGVFAQAEAGPVVSKKTVKVYYSSPIKEFRGVAMYQWKKYDTASSSSKAGGAAEKKVADKTATGSNAVVSAKSGN